jgi:hypothetical protein
VATLRLDGSAPPLFDHVCALIRAGLDLFSATECRNFIRHSGYRVTTALGGNTSAMQLSLFESDSYSDILSALRQGFPQGRRLDYSQSWPGRTSTNA